MMCPAAVRAQTPTEGAPDPAVVRIRMGPLWMNPTMALTNVGVDQNVFNEPDALNPKSDFTFTLKPMTDLWVHLGPTWLTGTVIEEINWYQKYASERTANTSYAAHWLVPLTRLTFKTGLSYRNARDRPGFEIDARALRKEFGYEGAVELRALSKTFVGVKASRQKIAFDEIAVFQGSNLHDELNRVETTAAVTLRHQLTTLTSLTFSASKETDRFEFSPLRDSDSTGASIAVNFDPFALIKGNATFGYRNFTPAATDLPAFQGGTASVDLAYALLGTTRFTFTARRDIDYSYDINQPYYLLTGVAGSVSQQIFGPFDVVGRIGHESLAYRTRAGQVVELSDRIDRVQSYGVGAGYRLGKQLRLGFNMDKTNRMSDVVLRRYHNLTFGYSLTYGP